MVRTGSPNLLLDSAISSLNYCDHGYKVRKIPENHVRCFPCLVAEYGGICLGVDGCLTRAWGCYAFHSFAMGMGRWAFKSNFIFFVGALSND